MRLVRCVRCHQAISVRNDAPLMTVYYCSECEKVVRDNPNWLKPEIIRVKEQEQEQEQEQGGVKDDNGKLEFWIPIKLLLEVQKIFDFGAQKYGVNNWRKGFKYTRCIHAIFRHFFAWVCGEQRDRESEFHHLASVCFYMLVLMDFDFEGIGIDDRYELYPLSESNQEMKKRGGVKGGVKNHHE